MDRCSLVRQAPYASDSREVILLISDRPIWVCSSVVSTSEIRRRDLYQSIYHIAFWAESSKWFRKYRSRVITCLGSNILIWLIYSHTQSPLTPLKSSKFVWSKDVQSYDTHSQLKIEALLSLPKRLCRDELRHWKRFWSLVSVTANLQVIWWQHSSLDSPIRLFFLNTETRLASFFVDVSRLRI